jgi:hypothetical protein
MTAPTRMVTDAARGSNLNENTVGFGQAESGSAAKLRRPEHRKSFVGLVGTGGAMVTRILTGHEALQRFVEREPLYRVHEYVCLACRRRARKWIRGCEARRAATGSARPPAAAQAQGANSLLHGQRRRSSRSGVPQRGALDAIDRSRGARALIAARRQTPESGPATSALVRCGKTRPAPGFLGGNRRRTRRPRFRDVGGPSNR